MNLLDLKELIKTSMLEVAPKKDDKMAPKGDSGAMTPEEEALLAKHGREQGEMDLTSGPTVVSGAVPMREAPSKSAEILNRPSNRMTFEQMGMIMMLADELGGEENAKADEFLSGTPSKMQADRYIQELIAKIDEDEDDVLAEAERIVAAWAEKQTIKEEMIGGYVDVMGPDFENGVNLLGKAWNTWKAGELTEPEMIDQARQDIVTLIQNKLV
jgi:hypothetical protein